MRYPVCITRAALVTPLDWPTDTWAALCAGRTVANHGVVAEQMLEDLPLDRATRLAAAAARRALADASVQKTGGLFLGTSKGPILSWLAAAEALRGHAPCAPDLSRQVALGASAMGADLAGLLQWHGPVHTSVAACASGLHALHRAVRAIEFGEIDSALVVAADASQHQLFEASFARLGVLAKPDADGQRRCRPFAEAGAGFFVSEAAAALVLRRGGAGVRVLRTWIGADATDMVATDPDASALRHGLATVGTRPPHFVHAHATGTAHDAHELAAIRAVFGPDVPVVSSKAALGHSLGAAGLVSLALSWHCHRAGQLWTGQPLLASPVSVTIAQGFGGHIAAVCLG